MDVLLTVAARLGVRAVARTHGGSGALVYAGFWWEYATGVPSRSQDALADGFGLTVKAFRAQVAALVHEGWLTVKGRGTGWKVELRVTQALLDSVQAELSRLRETVENGTFSGFSGKREKVETGLFSDEKVEIDRFVATPTVFPPGSVSAGYVRVWVEPRQVVSIGTGLANSSYTTNSSVVSSTTDTLVSVLSAAETPPRDEKAKAGKVDGPLPTKSSEYRRLPMTRIEHDPHFATITALHGAWNTALGVAYPLNPWRYAAWRTALVEQAYTVEQLTGAIPRVSADTWAKANLSDPHNMFTGNASKIERFFESNLATTHDRLGRAFPLAGSTFEF